MSGLQVVKICQMSKGEAVSGRGCKRGFYTMPSFVLPCRIKTKNPSGEGFSYCGLDLFVFNSHGCNHHRRRDCSRLSCSRHRRRRRKIFS